MLQILAQNVLNALQLGSVYALIALGYTMVYGILTLINFAHGDIFMVGTYLSLAAAVFLLGLPLGLPPGGGLYRRPALQHGAHRAFGGDH